MNIKNLTLAVGTSFAITWCSTIQDINRNLWFNQVRDETKNKTTEIIEIDTTTKKIESISIEDTKNIILYNDSTRFVWKNEIDMFNKFFFWNTDINANIFTNKVKELQKEFWVNQDGILWPITLRSIYLNYYSKNIESLSFESKKRLEIYEDMLWYRDKKWAIYHNLDIFKLETFYWKNMWVNLPWTYINENLVWKFPEKLDKKENLIIFKNINYKSALAFYVNGNLELATFASPGRNDDNDDNDEAFTPRLNTTWQRNPSKLHFSSLYPKTDTNQWWAVMPYAVHVDWPIWLHWSDATINWRPASAWCIRVWLYYMEYIHNRVSQLWIRNVRIDTRNIY